MAARDATCSVFRPYFCARFERVLGEVGGAEEITHGGGRELEVCWGAWG